MTTYKHIVQVHPVENGEPNLHKVMGEVEFNTEKEAQDNVNDFNKVERFKLKGGKRLQVKAVYYGRVNDATGELE